MKNIDLERGGKVDSDESKNTRIKPRTKKIYDLRNSRK